MAIHSSTHIRRRIRGFTLVEVMTAIAVGAIFVSLAVYALSNATRSARVSGARFTVMNAFQQARSRAAAQNTDVYLVFSNLESTSAFPLSSVPRVILYEDEALALRTTPALDDIMATIGAAPQGIFDEYNGLGTSYGMSGLTFVPRDGSVVPACPDAVPGYLGITGTRAARSDPTCGNALCTFCEAQAGQCVGALRFTPDGMVRAMTGPLGLGGVLKMVNLDSDARSLCIAFSEPTGLAVAF
ncbi:MAG: prepilin-type N-terminal cleavage/methylation domain-containing protein [Myxococcaceae bacterium]|nr:prepilin-type N-terminal cleavage/methylation domain-containing protein [Myxococcaceae bacterium]MCI0673193.1 prepilin-type N-terminal cleavage/methylation domain-containing protein [Myxococcaceae bacterium]